MNVLLVPFYFWQRQLALLATSFGSIVKRSNTKIKYAHQPTFCNDQVSRSIQLLPSIAGGETGERFGQF